MNNPMISPLSTAASVPPEPTPEPTPAPTPEPAEIDGTALAEAISVMPRNDDYHEACNRFNAGERSPDLYAYVLARLDT